MAELRVGEGQPYQTLEAAAGAARPGDEVIVTAGIYRERLVANTPDVTWRSEVPGAAVLAGGWDGQTVGAGRHSGQVQLSAPGARANSLVLYMQRRGRLAALADRCREIRPAGGF